MHFVLFVRGLLLSSGFLKPVSLLPRRLSVWHCLDGMQEALHSALSVLPNVVEINRILSALLGTGVRFAS
jgi:hypothetical protein